MTDTIRIKRRAIGGAAGAPSSLAASELAYNEVDDTLWYGKGNSGGTATSVVAVGGLGSFAAKAQGIPAGGSTGQILTKNSATNYDVTWTTPSGTFVDSPSDGTLYGRLNAGWVRGVQLGGDNMTGVLTISPASGDSSLTLNKPSGSVSNYLIGKNALSIRWLLTLGGGGETGSGNVGGDFAITRYSDAGSGIDSPISISRATGQCTFSQTGTFNGNVNVSVANPAIFLYKNSGERAAIGTLNRANSNRRWVLNLGDSTAESGSNAGSNFILQAFDDSSNALSAPITITRSNGQVTFGGPTSPMHQPPAGNHAAFSLNKPASGYLSYIQGLTAGVPRWTLYLGDNSGESGGNAGSDFALFRFTDGGATIDAPITVSRATGKVAVNGAPVAPVLPKYLSGLTLANDATTPNTVLDIDAGAACSDDNTTMMALLSAITKNCNAPWAVGSGNGAIDASSGSVLVANVWYHVFLIERTDTYVVDVLICSSLTPTLPSGYTKKRRIGSIKTNGSAQILAFKQIGDKFLWGAEVNQFTNVAGPTAVTLTTVAVPTAVQVDALLQVQIVNTGTIAIANLKSPDQTLTALNTGGDLQLVAPNAGTGTGGDFTIRTNTSAQINAIVNASTLWYVNTIGWLDNRGK